MILITYTLKSTRWASDITGRGARDFLASFSNHYFRSRLPNLLNFWPFEVWKHQMIATPCAFYKSESSWTLWRLTLRKSTSKVPHGWFYFLFFCTLTPQEPCFQTDKMDDLMSLREHRIELGVLTRSFLMMINQYLKRVRLKFSPRQRNCTF